MVACQQPNTSANNLSGDNNEEHAPSFPELFQEYAWIVKIFHNDLSRQQDPLDILRQFQRNEEVCGVEIVFAGLVNDAQVAGFVCGRGQNGISFTQS